MTSIATSEALLAKNCVCVTSQTRVQKPRNLELALAAETCDFVTASPLELLPVQKSVTACQSGKVSQLNAETNPKALRSGNSGNLTKSLNVMNWFSPHKVWKLTDFRHRYPCLGLFASASDTREGALPFRIGNVGNGNEAPKPSKNRCKMIRDTNARGTCERTIATKSCLHAKVIYQTLTYSLGIGCQV